MHDNDSEKSPNGNGNPEEAVPAESADEQMPPFEEALARLEKIVTELEEGRLPVDEMMKKFEEGMKLADYCNARLNEIRGKIEILVKKADGSVDWEEVDPGQLV